MSEVYWIDQDNDEWRCLIKEGFSYPYCGHELYLNNSFVDGVDLSDYSAMRLRLNYEGPAKTVRVFIRNFDPAYSRDDELKSTKYNAIEFEKELLVNDCYLELSLTDFSVADWWLHEQSIPLRHSYSDFSNIVIIELTGSGQYYGEHRFKLERIEFKRQMITTKLGICSLLPGLCRCLAFSVIAY